MKIDIEQVIDYLGYYHKYSDYYMASCVFLFPPHTGNDDNPSMRITERGYYCLACGARGSLEKLYSHVSGRPVQQRKTEYNPSAYIWDRWTEQYGGIAETCRTAHTQLMYKPELGGYLYKRGLTLKQVQSGELGFLGGYFIFPIRDEKNKIQGAVARASPTIQSKNNRYSASKNCPVKVYVPDWNTLCQSEEIYVPFGTLDAWSLLMAGYPSLTGISGQSFDFRNLDQFRKPIYIIADKKEHRKAMELQARLGWRGKRLDLPWDDGNKDCNDVHKNLGLDALRNMIETAKEKYNYD